LNVFACDCAECSRDPLRPSLSRMYLVVLDSADAHLTLLLVKLVA
jgi:hypothetical protein